MSENQNTEVAQEGAVEETKSKIEPPKMDFIRVNGGKVATSLDISSMRKERPEFSVGDTIEVHYKIREGDKERIQLYTGNVISIRGEGLGKSFIVRRVSHEIGVERIFPFHSPMIEKIKVTRKGRVRRSKLYYLRHKSGKAGRIKEAVNFSELENSKTGKKKATKKTAKKKTVSKKKTSTKKKATSKNKTSTKKKASKKK